MQPLSNRERLLRTLDFAPVDRHFSWEQGLWGQTLDQWLDEGLPPDVHIGNWLEGNEYFGFDRMGYLALRVEEMIPPFEEEVIEEDERYLTKRHADGHVSRALKEGSAHGTRMSMDQMLSFPVQDRAGFEAIRRRYNACSPARYPQWWDDVKRCLAGRDYPLALTHDGGFGLYSFLRRLMGTERACTIFYDDATLAHEMLDSLTDYFLELAHRALDEVQIDYFNYFEDYAFKTGPLVGPRIFRTFLLPRYQRINDFLRAHGVRHIWVDTDGNCEVLIPLMIEAGITCLWHLERAAGMDPVKIRAEYGHDLALVGGIDKLVLPRGRQAIEEELYYVMPGLLEDGGFIPTLDHTVQPGVPLANFLHYLAIKRKLLGV